MAKYLPVLTQTSDVNTTYLHNNIKCLLYRRMLLYLWTTRWATGSSAPWLLFSSACSASSSPSSWTTLTSGQPSPIWPSAGGEQIARLTSVVILPHEISFFISLTCSASKYLHAGPLAESSWLRFVYFSLLLPRSYTKLLHHKQVFFFLTNRSIAILIFISDGVIK